MRARSQSSRGAAVVEFALVTVLLLPMVFGLIDYGLWFNDSLNARSGVREGVRQAVVQADPDGRCAGGPVDGTSYPTEFDKMRCMVKQEIGAISGPVFVMVRTTSEGWVQGAPLLVCAAVRADGVTGLVPLPNDRLIRSKTRMSIEEDDTVPTGVAPSGASTTADPPPPGSDWDWCS